MGNHDNVQMENAINLTFCEFLRKRNGIIRTKAFSGHLNKLTVPQKEYFKTFGLKNYLKMYPDMYRVENENVILINQVMGVRNIPKSEYLETPDECLLCTELIDSIYASGKCRHFHCHKCIVQWRIICEKDFCPVCNANLDQIYFMKDPKTTRFIKGPHGFFYENSNIEEKIGKLLLHVCKICMESFPQMSELQVHLDTLHRKVFCAICLRHLKIFSVDRCLFDRSDIETHCRDEHTLCPYCDVYYADEDELHHHLATQHFQCSICCNETATLVFYSDVPELLNHFTSDHKVCNLCVEISPLTCAFLDEKDLTAHMQSTHRNGKKQKFRKLTDFEIPVEISRADNKFDYGKVAYIVEQGYSFIIPHAAKSRANNVYFDIEAMGFNRSMDLRNIVQYGDFVKYVAIEQVGDHGSRWRATTVEKISKNEYQKSVEQTNSDHRERIVERYTSENSACSSALPAQPTAGSTDWSSMVKKPPAPPVTPVKKPAAANKVETALHGYIYNLESNFGFLTKKQYVSDRDKNVFFNIPAYVGGFIGTKKKVSDLKKFLENGMKMYYELTKSSTKSKLRAKTVWRQKDRENVAILNVDIQSGSTTEFKEVKRNCKTEKSSMASSSTVSLRSEENNNKMKDTFASLSEDLEVKNADSEEAMEAKPPLHVTVKTLTGSDRTADFQRHGSMDITIVSDSNYVVVEDSLSSYNRQKSTIVNSNTYFSSEDEEVYNIMEKDRKSSENETTFSDNTVLQPCNAPQLPSVLQHYLPQTPVVPQANQTPLSVSQLNPISVAASDPAILISSDMNQYVGAGNKGESSTNELNIHSTTFTNSITKIDQTLPTANEDGKIKSSESATNDEDKIRSHGGNKSTTSIRPSLDKLRPLISSWPRVNGHGYASSGADASELSASASAISITGVSYPNSVRTISESNGSIYPLEINDDDDDYEDYDSYMVENMNEENQSSTSSGTTDKYFRLLGNILGGEAKLNLVKIALFNEGYLAKNLCFVEIFPLKGFIYFTCYHNDTMTLSKRLRVDEQFEVKCDLDDLVNTHQLMRINPTLYQISGSLHFIQIMDNLKKQIVKISLYYRD